MKPIATATVALAASLFATAAMADEPFGGDVWLASPQLCKEAKDAGSLQKTLDDGNLVLSAKGLSGADFKCHFVQVLKAPDVDAWVATALCRQNTAGDFPNMYSISKGSDGRLTLVTVYDDEEQSADAGSADGGTGSDEGAASPDGSAPAGDAAQPETPSAGENGAAAPSTSEADAGEPPEDTSLGDVYSRCEGIPAP